MCNRIRIQLHQVEPILWYLMCLSNSIPDFQRQSVRLIDSMVVPEKLRTLDHGRPWSDDQFASTRLSSNRDMSR